MKIVIKGSGVKFYFWINQWYSTLDLIKTHVDQARQNDPNYFYISSKDIENENKINTLSHVKSPSTDDEEKEKLVKEEKESKVINPFSQWKKNLENDTTENDDDDSKEISKIKIIIKANVFIEEEVDTSKGLKKKLIENDLNSNGNIPS